MSLELTRLEIDYLKKSQEELKANIKELTEQVSHMNEQLLEVRLGRKWLWGLLTASALVGATINHFISFIKLT